jgi:hypothetical protein
MSDNARALRDHWWGSLGASSVFWVGFVIVVVAIIVFVWWYKRESERRRRGRR